MTIGIVFGVITALLQALAYFFSRSFLLKGGSAGVLLVTSQIIIGIASLVIFPFVTPWEKLSLAMVGPLLLCSLCFMIGQLCFFGALRKIESSRIASVMGLKVVLVPLFLFCFFGGSYSAGQIGALVLALLAAMLINYQGRGNFALHGMGYAFLALLFYSWSDIGISMLVKSIELDNTLHAALVATNFNNLLVMSLLLPVAIYQRIPLNVFRRSAPYAVCWGGGIFCFFVCFGHLGAAFGNVVQSLRGPFSLFIGMALASWGFKYLEQKLPRRIWLCRIGASLLMVAAILLYALSGRNG